MRRLVCAGAVVAILAALPGASQAGAVTAQAVAVVVDFGDGRAPVVLCEHETGVSDAQVLADALAQSGHAGLRFGPTGLLCGIDGYPAGGCGAQSGAHYAYWAYFHGTSAGWSYAHEGPASHQASATTSIGFRFEEQGTGTPADPAPRVAPDPTVSCPASLSVTTTVPAEPGGATTTIPRAASSTTTVVGASSSTPQVESIKQAGGTTRTPTGSSPAPVILSILGLTAAIGAAVFWARSRRRRAG